MRTKLLLVDLVLLAAAVLLGMRLRDGYRQARARERRVLAAKVVPLAAPKLAPRRPLAPVSPAQYAEVAQQMLFSSDRNPAVILPPAKIIEKPVPPFPVAHGVMIFGSVPPTVILSMKGAKDQASYQAGDTIGEFKIVSIDSTDVVFEWDGKKFDKTIAELVDTSAPPQEASYSPPASTEPVVKQAGSLPDTQAANAAPSGSLTGPGLDLGAGYYACQTGDSSPDGTIVDGKKKVISNNPFGNGGKSCHWEVTR